MGMQPIAHGPAPTQMLPTMPRAKGDQGETPASAVNMPVQEKKPRTRTQAVRAALARITRRNSLRKQRNAQQRKSR
jgi:hypothetical protein